jgi:hypothetical protein
MQAFIHERRRVIRRGLISSAIRCEYTAIRDRIRFGPPLLPAAASAIAHAVGEGVRALASLPVRTIFSIAGGLGRAASSRPAA